MLCLVLLCYIVMFQRYNIIFYVTIWCRVSLYCCFLCNNFVLFCIVILLFCNVTVQYVVMSFHFVTIYRRIVSNNVVLYIII